MKNISELFEIRRGNGGGGILPKDGIMMSNQAAGGGRRAIAIAVGKGVMEQLRWVTGDRVTIDMDCPRSELTIRRVLPTDKSVASWTLSPRTGGKGDDKGKAEAATIKITATDLMLRAFGMDDATEPYIPSPIITGGNGVTFAMRKPWTVVQETRK